MKIVPVQTLGQAAFFLRLSEMSSFSFLVIILFRFTHFESFLVRDVILEIIHFLEDFSL